MIFKKTEVLLREHNKSKEIKNPKYCRRYYNGVCYIRDFEYDGKGYEKLLRSEVKRFKVVEIRSGEIKIDGLIAGFTMGNHDLFINPSYADR